VLSFLNLTAFEIMHKYPVNITLEEVEELASRWPSLEMLSLNEEPLVMHDFTLDLRALIPFARHCPKLRRLGLFMDGTTAKLEPHQTRELKPLAALSVLSVGTSKVHDPGTVAAFLSYICPPECKLDINLTWTSHSCDKLSHNVLSEVQARRANWKRVEDFLPLFIQLWRGERERSRALQREVENLRTGNAPSIDKSQAAVNVIEVNTEASDSSVPRRQTNRRKAIAFKKGGSCIIA